MVSVPALQPDAPIEVYNGPSQGYSVNTRMNPNGSATQLVGVADEWSDAFGRLRVSNPFTLFESSFTYDLHPVWFETKTATSGTVAHDTDSRSAILTATADSGSTAAIQSRAYFPYEKGKSQLVKITFGLGAAVADVRRRVGYFDAANGFFVEQTGAGLSMVRRSSATGALVDTQIPQAAWNIDPLDGSGASGVVFDETKGQILVVDGQWLGVGRVRVGFNIDGATYYVHEFLHANRADVAPYTQTFSLPVRWEIESTAASAGGTFKAICAEVESEGGISSPNGYTFSAANLTDVTTSTTRAHVLSIRPALDFPAASGQTNRTFIIPGSIAVSAEGRPCLIEVFHGSTLTGGTWTRANANSAVEFGVGQAITTAGLPAASFFVAAASGSNRGADNAGIDSQYPLSLSIAGDAPLALTIAATALAASGTVRAAIGWKEVR